MLDFFDYIVAFIENIGTWFNNMLQSMLQVLSLLLNIPTMMANVYGFVPPILATCAAVVVSVSVAKLILGWGNS